jgi:heme exporter protein D
MNWSGPVDFLAMGGYAFYVWGAYVVTVACLLVEPVLASRRHRRALADAAADDMRGETVLDASR